MRLNIAFSRKKILKKGKWIHNLLPPNNTITLVNGLCYGITDSSTLQKKCSCFKMVIMQWRNKIRVEIR